MNQCERDEREFEKHWENTIHLGSHPKLNAKRDFMASIEAERVRSAVLENCFIQIMEGSDVATNVYLAMEIALRKYRGENDHR